MKKILFSSQKMRLNFGSKNPPASALLVVILGFTAFVSAALWFGEISMGGTGLKTKLISRQDDPMNYWVSVIGFSLLCVIGWLYILALFLQKRRGKDKNRSSLDS